MANPWRKSKPTLKSKCIKEADKLWSEVIRARDKVCQYCRARPAINAHHIFTRKIRAMRWDPQNGIGLCGGCHMNIAHGQPELFRRFLVKRLGVAEYERMFIQSQVLKGGGDPCLIAEGLRRCKDE